MLSKTAAIAAQEALNQPEVVQVHNLVKHYGQTLAVNGVNLSIRQGEIFGLLGPNGAGKSTTLEIIEGIRAQDSGDVTVLGLDVRRQRRKVQARIGIQLQATTLFDYLNVRETVTLFGSFYPHALPTDLLLQRLSLEEKAQSRPQDLSGGQRQRLALALALVNNPDIIFLDEPTAGLDPQSRHALWEIVEELRQEGKTVILTTHFMDEAQRLCDRIAIIDHGQIIAQDTPAGLISLLGASAMISCSFKAQSAGAVITDEALRKLPMVSDVRLGLEQTLIYTESVEQTLAALLQLTQAHATQIDHLQIHAPTLEDVFLKLTGHQLRD